MIKLLTVLIAMMLSTSAMTQTLRTLGAYDCGEWVAREKNRFSEDRANTWLAGFMTGLNFDGKGRDSLRKVSAEQIYLWMDNYCKANPLSTTVTGGQLLMNELNKK
jgi:hypothetical protein